MPADILDLARRITIQKCQHKFRLVQAQFICTPSPITIDPRLAIHSRRAMAPRSASDAPLQVDPGDVLSLQPGVPFIIPGLSLPDSSRADATLPPVVGGSGVVTLTGSLSRIVPTLQPGVPFTPKIAPIPTFLAPNVGPGPGVVPSGPVIVDFPSASEVAATISASIVTFTPGVPLQPTLITAVTKPTLEASVVSDPSAVSTGEIRFPELLEFYLYFLISANTDDGPSYYN
jgi:hypothetical protein